MLRTIWRRFLSRLKSDIQSPISKRRSRSLFLEPLEDRITPATVSWINPAGGSWNNPANWSSGALPAAGDDVVINLAAGEAVQLSGGSASINSLQLGDTLLLDGGALSVAGNLVNAGTIQLESNGAGNALVVRGTLTNDPGAVLSADQGAASVQQIAANIDNQGTISVASGVGLVIQGATSSGPNVTQAGGTLTVAGGGWVVQLGGVFHFTGGALPAEFVAFNSELDIENTVSATAVIEVRGNQNVLENNLAHGVTLWVQGWDGNGNAELTTANGAVNDGTILLASGGAGYNCDLAVAAGGTFTNAADGVIDAQAGTGGGRDVYGNWVNYGTVNVEPGTGLLLQGVASQGPAFTQAGGTLTVPGGSWVVQVGGVFHYTGGALPGEFVAFNSELDIENTVTATAVIEVRGNQNTLDRNLAPGVTLWVQGWNGNGNAELTAANGAANDGTILLESGGAAYNSDLAVANGGTFTNAADGVIDVQAGSGGGRDVYGNWINYGTVDVEPGTGLNLQGASSSGPNFTQAGGTLTVPGGGWVVQVGGVFHFTGGALPGEFVAFDSELDIADTVTATAVIEIRGAENVLDENRTPGVTLWVQGWNGNGDADLTAAAGAVNDGTILLESGGAGYNCNLATAAGGSFTNAADGVIDVEAGTGGGRLIQGTLNNEGLLKADTAMQWSGALANAGTVTVAAGVQVNVAGLNGAAPSLSQTAGSLTVNGSLLLPDGTLDVQGARWTATARSRFRTPSCRSGRRRPARCPSRSWAKTICW
ncbi:MAG TPA: hypothetical protein VMS17_21175 [Gemmataceae bacterium]|nr:hypothetical protein [Gemmataceae bacterium]